MTVTHPLVEVEGDNVKGVAAGFVKYFEKKQGQTLTEFAAEIKELTTDDKVQLLGGIRDETFDYQV